MRPNIAMQPTPSVEAILVIGGRSRLSASAKPVPFGQARLMAGRWAANLPYAKYFCFVIHLVMSNSIYSGERGFCMLPAWLTEQQWYVVNQVLDVLENNTITYQVTGGLAGNIHGSNWPLHDIDIDLHQADIFRFVSAFQSFVTRPYSRYQDTEFDLFLVTLTIGNVSVDMSQVEEAFLIVEGGRHPLPSLLVPPQRKDLRGRDVWVQPLEQLVAYKRLIGRSTDVADLERLMQR